MPTKGEAEATSSSYSDYGSGDSSGYSSSSYYSSYDTDDGDDDDSSDPGIIHLDGNDKQRRSPQQQPPGLRPRSQRIAQNRATVNPGQQQQRQRQLRRAHTGKILGTKPFHLPLLDKRVYIHLWILQSDNKSSSTSSATGAQKPWFQRDNLEFVPAPLSASQASALYTTRFAKTIPATISYLSNIHLRYMPKEDSDQVYIFELSDVTLIADEDKKKRGGSNKSKKKTASSTTTNDGTRHFWIVYWNHSNTSWSSPLLLFTIDPNGVTVITKHGVGPLNRWLPRRHGNSAAVTSLPSVILNGDGVFRGDSFVYNDESEFYSNRQIISNAKILATKKIASKLERGVGERGGRGSSRASINDDEEQLSKSLQGRFTFRYPSFEHDSLNTNDAVWSKSRLVGKGSYGEVVRVPWMLADGRRTTDVVVKLVRVRVRKDDKGNVIPQNRTKVMKDALREIAFGLAISKSNKSDHMVKMYGWFVHGEEIGLVMESLQHDLAFLLNDSRRRSSEFHAVDALRVVRDSLIGIMDLSEKYGFVHRDIKQANVMVDSNGNGKIVDLAFVYPIGLSANTAGSKKYQPPEVTAARETGNGKYAITSYYVDLYALAIMIIHDVNPIIPLPNQIVTMAKAITSKIAARELSTMEGCNIAAEILLKALNDAIRKMSR